MNQNEKITQKNLNCPLKMVWGHNLQSQIFGTKKGLKFKNQKNNYNLKIINDAD